MIDWIKSYPSVEAVEADRDWKDDGAEDADEALQPVVNETTNIGYDNLTSAWNEVKTGETLLVSKDQIISTRMGADGREITIKGRNSAKLIRDKKLTNSLMFLSNTNSANILHFEDIIIDGGSVVSSKAAIEATANAWVTFRNVVLENNHTTNTKVVDVKNNAYAIFENVRFENSKVPDNGTDLFVGSDDRVTLIGDNSFSIRVEKTYQIKSEALSNAVPLPIYIDDNRNLSENNTIVTNCTKPECFELRTVDFAIEVNGNNNLILVPIAPKAVEFDKELTGGKVESFTVTASVGSTIYMQVTPTGTQSSLMAVAAENEEVDITDGTWEKNANTANPHVMEVNVNSILSERGPATLKFVAVKNDKVSPVSMVSVSDSGTTGIEEVAVEGADEAVEWYNMQGMRVENPTKGIFIRRQGNRVEKVVVK